MVRGEQGEGLAGEVVEPANIPTFPKSPWKTAVLVLVLLVFVAAAAWYAAIGFGLVKRLTMRSGPHEVDVEIAFPPTTVHPWREGQTSSVDWGTGPVGVEVETRLLDDGLLHVRNRFKWLNMYRDIDLWVAFDPKGMPTARADMNTHDPDGSVRPFYGIHGTIKLSSNRLPTDAEQPLIVAYDLEGDHGGSAVGGSGTIAVYPADLR